MNQTPPRLTPAKIAFFLLLTLILAAGAFLRFSNLDQPLLDFHPTRQLFSAIKTRGMYYQTVANAPAWQKDISYRQWQGEATIEPPIVENIAVFLYTRLGQENSAYPRAVSASFWLIAAVFIFLLAKNLTNSPPAAAVSTAFFLLVPYAIPASRAFQPDPLMVMFVTISWWSLESWGCKNTWRWAILAGFSGGLAIFVKLPAVFFIASGAIGVILAYSNLVSAFKNPKAWLVALLCILPPAAYLYYGLYVAGFLGQQFGGRFFPEFWFDPYFYLRWLLKVDMVVSVFWLSLALIGWLVFAAKPVKTFLAALWSGYILYGLIFPHHIASHDYYSLPLIPLAALCLAPLAANILPRLWDATTSHFASITILLSSFFFLFSYTAITYLEIRQADTRPAVEAYAQIGEALQRQPGIIALTEDYGYPLAYYGWQNVSLWYPADDFEQGFSEQTFEKAYFVVTDFDELARQPELAQKLAGYQVFAQSREYSIYDLKAPLPSATP